MEWFPQILVTAVAVQISCQLFKFVLYSVRDRRVSPHYLVTAGGIPSAHSAFVTALSTAIAIRHGVTSDVFAISFVFSAIVIYDAFRLRGHVQRHAEALNRFVLEPHGEQRMSEMVGHTPVEIAVGVVFGALVSALITLTLGA